jgi:hypothetical protein
MVGFRTHGFESQSQLREYLEELEEASANDQAEEKVSEFDEDASRREIGWLRKEVADLRERLAIAGEAPLSLPRRVQRSPWLSLAAAFAAAFLAGRAAAVYRR